MFGGNNATPYFPLTAAEENQFQYDSVASTQLQLFGNVPSSCNVDATNFTGNNTVLALNRPSKRSKETEDLGRQHKLQISLNNLFQDETDHSRSIPNPNAVSTGLRLSYDDDEHNSSVTSASGSVPYLPIISSLGNNLGAEIDRQKEEVDHYIKIQEERISKGLKEMKQRHMTSFLNAVENGMGRKLKEKEFEIENMNRKNRELFEQIKQVSMEAQAWHNKARCNELLVNSLKNDLQQAIAQGADQGKEGCGDSEVDDAVSSYNPNGVIGGYPQPGAPGGKGATSEQMACKSCRTKEVCMLMIPCRHLCLCEDCVGFIDVCPICRCVKTASVQVHL